MAETNLLLLINLVLILNVDKKKQPLSVKIKNEKMKNKINKNERRKCKGTEINNKK